jgi:hypothetical protein
MRPICRSFIRERAAVRYGRASESDDGMPGDPALLEVVDRLRDFAHRPMRSPSRCCIRSRLRFGRGRSRRTQAALSFKISILKCAVRRT